MPLSPQPAFEMLEMMMMILLAHAVKEAVEVLRRHLNALKS